MTPELEAALHIGAAAFGGAAVGVERQWSGHASGPHAHFAGIRTFTLLGGVAGVAGWLYAHDGAPVAIVLLCGAVALVVAGYVAASRHHADGTTEVAALVVVAAGVLAGSGRLVLASGIIAITNLLLVEKSRLHSMVRAIDDQGLRAGIRFAVMAVVVLPLLPDGAYGPGGVIRPRQVWSFVLVFSGVSFAGWIAQRLVGARRGYALAGLFGGLVSSTGTTLALARASANRGAPTVALASGVATANTVMFARVLTVAAVLDRALAAAVAPHALVPFAAGTMVTLATLRRAASGEHQALPPQDNPLQIGPALLMALVFQTALGVVTAAHTYWGKSGFLTSSVVLGTTDIDALTFSLVQGTAGDIPTTLAATALALGMLGNTILKLVLTLAIGRGRFRIVAGGALLVVTLALAASLAFTWQVRE